VEVKEDAQGNLLNADIKNQNPIQRIQELEEDIVKLNYKLIKSII
jgi:hypothetical protein